MSFTMSGLVQTIEAAEGDRVTQGDVLVRLETTDMDAQAAQAQTAVKVAQAQLALLKTPPRPEQIAAAKAQLEAAEALFSQAAARRDQLGSGAKEADIAAAEAQVAAAQADQLAAREAHDQTLKCHSGGNVCPLLGTQEEQARFALFAADEALEAALARLDAIKAGMEAITREAESAVRAATAQRDAAQAQLDLLLAGASEQEIAVAESAVAQAEASLEAARSALEKAALQAPFSGTVARLSINPGETVIPGQVVLVLADLDRLQVRTTDLSERDTVKVSIGQKATIYIEPLGIEIAGQVAAIAPQATTVGGDVVYEAILEMDKKPEGLRWGMSVEVEIEE